ncbi:MAG: hypothetical protein ACOH2M_14585 [Cypionkella sp.]
MCKAVKNFFRDESGAVTVDWVVLSAAIIGLGMVVLAPVAFETTNSTQNMADNIKASPVGYENQ